MKKYIKKGKNNKVVNIIVLTLCVIIIVMSAFALFFSNTAATHTHDMREAGGECSMCLQIQFVQTILKHSSFAILLFAIAVIGNWCLLLVVKFFIVSNFNLTPIVLKIRMNN